MKGIEITRVTCDGTTFSFEYNIVERGISGRIRLDPKDCSDATIKKMIQQDLEEKKEIFKLLEELKEKYAGQKIEDLFKEKT